MICNRPFSGGEIEQKEVRRIYETSFPVDERRDYDSLLQLVEQEEAFNLEVVYRDDVVVGFISSWHFDAWRYVEHFAVEAAVRGCGIGQEVLRRFLDSDVKPVVLEVEPPTDATSRKRIEFYKRQGFRLHDSYRYIQPPYDPSKNPVELLLMTCNAPCDCDLDALATLLHRRVYGVKG